MSGPTEGPWEQDGTGVYKYHDDGYTTVAQCFDYAGGPDEADGVDNARLIASAPELLAEAELAVRVLLQAERDAIPYYERTLNGLRAAIAKAKGEEVPS